MRIRFLGTGAATAAPLPFCRCDFCQELRRARQFRRRASLLIDDSLIIDFGPDVPQMASELDIDLTRIDTVLQTHSHADHFDAGHIVTRIPGYAAQDQPELLLMGSPLTMEHIREKLMREEGDDADIFNRSSCAGMSLTIRSLQPGEAVQTCRYDILPIAVPHDVRDGSVIYVVTDRQTRTSVLYATDSPAFPENVWQQLSALRLDCAIMDHTYGTLPHSACTSHMDAHQFAATARRLRETGILKPDAPIYATHISHEAHGSIARMQSFADENGYILPRDGLSVEI